MKRTAPFVIFALVLLPGPQAIRGQDLVEIDRELLETTKQSFERIGATVYGDWWVYHSGSASDVAMTTNKSQREASNSILALSCLNGGPQGAIEYRWGRVLEGDYLGRVELSWIFLGGQGREGDIVYLGLAGNTTAIPFDPWVVSQAKSASRLVMRITDPADETRVGDIFSLDGFSDALSELPCADQL